MAKYKEITGKKFNRLTAIRFIKRNLGEYFWLFKCHCGISKIIRKSSVMRGITKSCGCLAVERLKQFPNGITHHMTKTRFYKIFMGLKYRCENLKASNFKNYGRRGIKCLWVSFEEFRDDMYEDYQSHIKLFGIKNTQIDRIDNNGNYCKENCRWATFSEQNLNKSNVRIIEFNKIKKPLSEWARIYSLPVSMLFGRINRNWKIKDALETPNLHGKWK